jgi:hypothetical protein
VKQNTWLAGVSVTLSYFLLLDNLVSCEQTERQWSHWQWQGRKLSNMRYCFMLVPFIYLACFYHTMWLNFDNFMAGMQFFASEFGLCEIQKLLVHLFLDVSRAWKWTHWETVLITYVGTKDIETWKTENLLQNKSTNRVGSYGLDSAGSS